MAFDPLFKMSIQDANGNYYTGTQNADATWQVAAIGPQTFLGTLPDGWEDTAITWERDTSYMGVFRSQTNSSYRFTRDGRAILQYLRSQGGIQAYGLLTIYMFNQQTFNYDTFYQSELDFTTYRDIHWQQITEIGTLDSGLIRDLHAYGDTVYNIPIWNVIPAGMPSTPARSDLVWVLDDGIKLLYQANFTSAASTDLNINLNYSPYEGGFGGICGFNHGINQHSHTIPAMSQYNIVQNNGATTFIGNDILEPFLIQNNQSPGASHITNETDFSGANNSQPYTRNNFSLKNAIPYAQGQSFIVNVRVTGTFTGWNSIAGAITGHNVTPGHAGTGYGIGDVVSINGTTGAAATIVINSVDGVGGVLTYTLTFPGNSYHTGTGFTTTGIATFGNGFEVDITDVVPSSASVFLTHPPTYTGSSYLAFAVFEIQRDDFPTAAHAANDYGAYFRSSTPTAFWKYHFNTSSSGWHALVNADFDSGNVPMQINPNCAYVFCILFDDETGTGFDTTRSIYCSFSELQASFTSLYDYGNAATYTSLPDPIPAPQLNPSVYAGYRLNSLMEILTTYLSTKNTDLYGFPVLPPVIPYTATSGYLSGTPVPGSEDIIPYQTVLTSAYCLHNLQGYSYLSLSMNQLFDFCKKIWGCGLGVIGNMLTMENLGYYFNKNMMILDLGIDVAEFEIQHMTQGIGANLHIGYSKADTNTDFGVDSFITDLYFDTPAANVPQVMDYQETNIIADQYQKEKARAQQVSQPVGSGYDPANPSQNNQTYALYCCPYNCGFILPSTSFNFQPIDANGLPVWGVAPYRILMYNGVNNSVPNTTMVGYAAQSTDPFAISAPYINGMYYPDTAQNIPLSPCRALQRDLGALIHSILDNMDNEHLIFRQTGVMQYNNQALSLSGISSNITPGSAPITEMQDIQIGDLPGQLFKPVLLKVTSKYPVNMYQALNNTPYGYIQFQWQEAGYDVKTYKFFLSKITQKAGNQESTVFEGWATPDMVI